VTRTVAAVAAALALAATASAAAAREVRAELPVARTRVTATTVGSETFDLRGYAADRALGGRVLVIGGGPQPGLTVTAANAARIVPGASRRLTSAEAGSKGLIFTRANGSRIVFGGRLRAWCGAWNDPKSPRSLHVAVLRRRGLGFALPYWHLSAVASDITRPRVIRFPVGVSEARPHGVVVFVADSVTGNEASTEQEEARGSISFAQVRCAPGNRVRFTISAVLGSEFGDGRPIRVAGAYAGTIGARPPGFPP